MFASPATFALLAAFQPHPNPELCGNDAAEDQRVTEIVARLIEKREKGENIQRYAQHLALAYDYETLCTGYRRFADQKAPEGFQTMWRDLQAVFWGATERQNKAEMAFRG